MHGSGLILDAAAILGREVVPRRIDVANPGAGNEFRINVPGGSIWWVQTFRARFTTSAVAGNRTPEVALFDSDSEFYRFPQQTIIGVSQVAQANFSRGLGAIANINTAAVGQYAPWPDIPIIGGWSIRSITTAIDPGDAYSAITLYVLEVEETPYMVELARDVAGLRSGRSDAIPDLASRG